MRVQVKLFAALQAATGTDVVEVHLADSATVANLRRAMAEQYPEIAPLLPNCLLALDAQYAQEDTPLADATEIACIPPVSGG